LTTREETIAKYGIEKLCNDTFHAEATTFDCQILADKRHTWHIEKGLYHGNPFTMAWKNGNIEGEHEKWLVQIVGSRDITIASTVTIMAIASVPVMLQIQEMTRRRKNEERETEMWRVRGWCYTR
jgi:hypothetical protein